MRSTRTLTALVALLFAAFLTLPAAHAQTAAEPVDDVEWYELPEALTIAQESGKRLLIDVYAPWCGWCDRLQTDTYTDAEVQALVEEHFVVARLNIDVRTDSLQFREFMLSSAELAAGLGAQGTPTTVFLEPSTDYITRVPGFISAEDFREVLRFIAGGTYTEQNFQEWKEAQGDTEEGER
jgi:thioredoxin-related protein